MQHTATTKSPQTQARGWWFRCITFAVLNSNRIILITGASGAIGSEIAIGFSRLGGKVVLTARNEDKLKKVSERIAALGGQSLVYKMDVRVRSEVEKVLDDVELRWGVTEILINNAGVQNKTFFLKETDEDWDRVLGVNLKGAWICSQTVSGRMITAQKKGAIINIGSIASEVADSNQVTYAVSKGGMRSLTKALGIALAPYGIRVNAVAPQTVVSSINRDYFKANPEQLEARLQRSPLGRLSVPEDLVGATLFLASEMASFITATTLYVDGGRLSLNVLTKKEI